MILERIQSPEDVKALSLSDCQVLCSELRAFLIAQVSRTGGHLASNLGMVELTVAIHRVFDTSKDRLVFDVGHQCYVHKILTGRRDLFPTLRQFGGLSGFPKPSESEHDSFIAGHASNSVSVALGMARARSLLGKSYSVLALIGDGALSGGLAYEGLNNAGASGEPLIVILNDNGMSISPNVGAVSVHLARLRSKPAYYHFKKWYRGLFGSKPEECGLYRFNHRLKSSLKRTLLPTSTLFEDMGFTYLGPVDGHDLDRLCHTLQWAKDLQEPVLIHVKTVKGKGYPYAERYPDRFHGIDPFDPETGLSRCSSRVTFSSVFGKALTECAEADSRVCAITAAMTDGTGLSAFRARYPNRFFDVGIAEGHAAAMAAGLAKQGMLPVFAVYSTFLQRAYDMLIHDIALQRLHVVLGVDRAGLVGADGETHHGCFDALYLSAIPWFTVLCPSNFAELRSMLRQALFQLTGPVALRYPRGGEGAFQRDCSGQPAVRLRDGSDGVIVAYGMAVNHALSAADTLAQEGFALSVVKLNQIAPLDSRVLAEQIGKTALLVCAEDCFASGCIGQQVAALLSEQDLSPERSIFLNCRSTFPQAGTVAQLENSLGIDAAGIVRAVREAKA